MARSGGIQVMYMTGSDNDSRLTLTACELSDGKEVKDVFGRPGAHVGVGSARLRPLAAHCVGCPAADPNLENWTTVPSLYSVNIAECDVKPQPTNLHIKCNI